jgi:hypothetical protein
MPFMGASVRPAWGMLQLHSRCTTVYIGRGLWNLQRDARMAEVHCPDSSRCALPLAFGAPRS